MIFKLANVELGSNDAGGAQDLVLQADKVMQEEPILGAASMPQFDRGNHQRIISFAVTREYADYHTAEAALCDFVEQVMDLSGTMELVQEGVSGSRSIRYSRNAVVRSVTAKQFGVSVDFTFRIRGDRLVTK